MSMLGDSGLSGLPKQPAELLEVGHTGPSESSEVEAKTLDSKLVPTVALRTDNLANHLILNNVPNTQNLPLANIVAGVPNTNFASDLMSRVVRTAYSATLLQSLGRTSPDGNLTFALKPLST